MTPESNEWERLDQLLGQRIRATRESRAMSQQDLVEKLHSISLTSVNSMTISRIEQGTRPVRATELQAIAEVLEVSPWELLTPNEVVKYEQAHRKANDARLALLEATVEFMQSRRELATRAARADLAPEDVLEAAAVIAERPEDAVSSARLAWFGGHDPLRPPRRRSQEHEPEYSQKVADAVDKIRTAETPEMDDYIWLQILANDLEELYEQGFNE